MGRVYLVFLLTAILLFILFLTRVKLRLRYLRQGKDDEFALEISFWRGLFCYKLEVPVIEIQNEKAKQRRKAGTVSKPWSWRILRPAFKISAEIEGKGGRPIAEEKRRFHLPGFFRLMKILINNIRLIKKYEPVIIYLLGRVHLRRFQWKTRLGCGEPAQTAFLTGATWGIKGFILSFIYRLLHPGGVKPVVAVTPSFEKTCFDTMFDCILEIRAGCIIMAGFKAFVLRFKRK